MTRADTPSAASDAGDGASSAARIRVGYLHIGREHSGVRRYGRLLATAAAERPDLDIIESDAGGRDASWRQLREAARGLSGADIVHLQWKLADWDPRLGGIPRMEAVLQALPRPVLLTLHDVFERSGARERWLSPSALGMRRLGMVAARLVVHSEEERRRLAGMVPAAKVSVIPHFVESRPSLPEREPARAALDVSGRHIITLLGYMTRRRGHGLVLEALTHLPDDVIALFVGSPIEGRDHIASELEERARELGVHDRVRFMGYVSDERLEQVLAATDVALCPFREMSASGALATWISAGRPIVASDLPAIRELDALEADALHTFSPYEPGALAGCIEDVLAGAGDGPDEHVRALAASLSMARTVERHVALYRAALGRT